MDAPRLSIADVVPAHTDVDILDWWRLNHEHTRFARGMPFGFACYEGEVVHGQFTGIHQGVVGTPEEAEDWVMGKDVKLLRVHRTEPE